MNYDPLDECVNVILLDVSFKSDLNPGRYIYKIERLLSDTLIVKEVKRVVTQRKGDQFQTQYNIKTKCGKYFMLVEYLIIHKTRYSREWMLKYQAS